MVKRRNLRPDPKRAMADLERRRMDAARQADTRPHGVKDMGKTGDSVFTRPDGTRASVRDTDADLAAAQSRIDDAAAALVESQERVDAAVQAIADADARLDTVETTTIPGAVAQLEAADQEAQETLTELDARLTTVDGTSGDLASIREALASAQQAVQAAQGTADAAVAAANSANQAALQAAGIADAKGQVIYSEARPAADLQKPSNLWIMPSTEQTFVWSDAAGDWELITSDLLDQAAQNAVDAQNTANQAKQTAETAIANAQTAQAAAEAAQRTADQATLSARDAHNEAVAAQEAADAAIARGDSLLANGSFEQGDFGWPPNGSHGGRSRIIEDPGARTGTHVLEITPVAANVYPESDFVAVEPGQVLRVRGWLKHLGGDGGICGLLVRHHDANKAYLRITFATRVSGVQNWTVGEWTLLEGEITVPEDVRWFRFAFHATGPSTSTYHADDFQVVDVTEARKAQQRADDAHVEVAKRPTTEQVTAQIVTSANGKNAIKVSADAPTNATPGVVAGDTWWRVDAQGTIYGQWRWTPLPVGWVPVTIRSEVISNLDVGKLVVTGSSSFATAVVDRLFADLFTAHKITATEITLAALDADGNLAAGSVGTTSIREGAVTTSKLTVTDTMAAKLVEAMSTVTKRLIVTEDAVLQHVAILGQTVVEDINVHGKLVGTDGVFTGTVDFENVNVTGEVLADMIMAARGLIAGNPAADHLAITGQGMILYGLDPDGVKYEMVRIGPSGLNLMTIGRTTIAPDGVSSPAGAFDQATVGGVPLTGAMVQRIEDLPRGVVASMRRTTNTPMRANLSRIMEVYAVLEPGRRYEVRLSSVSVNRQYSSAVQEIDVSIAEGTRAQVEAGTAMTEVQNKQVVVPSGAWEASTGDITYAFNSSAKAVTSPTEYVFTARIWSPQSAQVLASWPNLLTLSVHDVGRAVPQTGAIWNDQQGTGGEQTTPTETRREYTWTSASSGFSSYWASGGKTSDDEVIQGSYNGTSSRERVGLWTWNNVPSLAGASIEWVEIEVRNTWTYGSSGGYLNLALHGHTAPPASSPSLASLGVTQGIQRGQKVAYRIPASQYARFVAGEFKGIGVDAPTTATSHYSRFASRAYMTIRYTR